MTEGNTIDYDKYGHCIRCHKDMKKKQVVDGKLIERFLPDYDEMTYLINDGSKMRVATCKECKEFLTNNDTDKTRKEIMTTAFKGWQREVEILQKGLEVGTMKEKIKWSKERADKYLKEYKKKEIIVSAENRADDALQKELKKYKDKKRK